MRASINMQQIIKYSWVTNDDQSAVNMYLSEIHIVILMKFFVSK